jgi:hypothetical protein
MSQNVPVADVKTQEQVARANRTTECLNGVAYAVAKNLLKQVSNKTLNWVNRGLGGNPLYVQDVESNLRTIRNEKLQGYLNTVQTSNPVFGNAIRSAITQQVTGISDGYLNKVMDTPEAREYDAFQQDFTRGGWGALLNMNNNPIGALFQSADTISKEIDTAQEIRKDEIQRNDGFLDMKVCVQYESPVGSILTNVVNGGIAGVQETTSGSTLKTTAKQKCLKYKTVTPGSVISSQVQNVLGSPTRQLEMADSINEVLGSFFDQMINGLFQKGLASLQGGGNTSGVGSSGYGSNVVLGTNGLPIGTTGGTNAFGYTSTGSGVDVEEFDISRPQQLRAITQAQYGFLNRAKDSQIALQTIVPVLGALDYCIPGPNPTWREGINENLQSFLGSFVTPTKDVLINKVNLAQAGMTVLGGAAAGAALGSVFPGIGNVIGAVVGAIVGLIAGIFSGGGDTKEVQYALLGDPVLFDKVTASPIPLSSWLYMYYTSDYERGVKNTDGNWIRNWISSGYDRVIPKYQSTFTDQKITDLFTAADPANATYVTGFVKDSMKETAKITTYSTNFDPLDQQYTQAISDKEDAIAELESIRKEALAIVKVAKARHIKEQASAGNPVNLACINKAYVIDETPIKAPARQESDTNNPFIDKSNEASQYFYKGL